MKRTPAQWVVAIAVLVLLGAGRASAQTPAPPPAPAPESAPATTETRPHMRGSHTVDVIAPGEKVDTILGRMRPERPLPPPRADTVRPPPGPDTHGGPPNTAPGRTEQSRPLEAGRDNGRDATRSPPLSSPRGDGNIPPPPVQRPPTHR